MNEEEIKKRIVIYRKEFTEKMPPPECANCNENAVLHDTGAGENYCDNCLEKSLRLDVKELKGLTDKYV